MEKKTSDDRPVNDIDVLTETVAQLATAISTQNDVLMCLLHKFDVEKDTPVWLTKEGLEEEVGPKVEACMKAVRRLYGHSETDKS